MTDVLPLAPEASSPITRDSRFPPYVREAFYVWLLGDRFITYSPMPNPVPERRRFVGPRNPENLDPTRKAMIYAYEDPHDPSNCERAGRIRYVGRSVNPEKELLIRKGRKTTLSRPAWKYPVVRWVRSLEAQGLSPRLIILESVVGEGNWDAAERKWIAVMRARDEPLLNLTDGGEGFTPGEARRIATSLWANPEWARKRRASYRTPEYRAKISAIHKGRIPTEETRRRMSAAKRGRKFTEQWRQNMSAALRKHYALNPESAANYARRRGANLAFRRLFEEGPLG